MSHASMEFFFNHDHMNIDAIIAAAMQKPSGEERSNFLERACGGNHALRLRLEALLSAQHPNSSADQREPSKLTPPPPPKPPAADRPEIIPPPPIAFTPHKPRSRSPRRSPLATSKLPASVLTAIGVVAASAMVLAIVWMSRGGSDAESPDAVARRDRPVSSGESHQAQRRGSQAPTLRAQVSVDGATEQRASGGTTVRHNPGGTVVTGTVTNRSGPPPEVTSGTSPRPAAPATPQVRADGKTESVDSKDCPVELPSGTKVTNRSETSRPILLSSGEPSIMLETSIMFTSSKSVVELDLYFIERFQKGGYEIIFDGITNEADGLHGFLDARRRDDHRLVVRITSSSNGRGSSAKLVWTKLRADR